MFNIGKSKVKTIENLELYEADYLGIKNRLDSICEEIEYIDSLSSEETFFKEVERIVPRIDWESVEIVKEYPYGARVVVDLFERYIQPKIREDFAS